VTGWKLVGWPQPAAAWKAKVQARHPATTWGLTRLSRRTHVSLAAFCGELRAAWSTSFRDPRPQYSAEEKGSRCRSRWDGMGWGPIKGGVRAWGSTGRAAAEEGEVKEASGRQCITRCAALAKLAGWLGATLEGPLAVLCLCLSLSLKKAAPGHPAQRPQTCWCSPFHSPVTMAGGITLTPMNWTTLGCCIMGDARMRMGGSDMRVQVQVCRCRCTCAGAGEWA